MLTDKNKESELEIPEMFLVRCEAMIRALYYCYKDTIEYGETDHESLKTYVDSLIYNSLTLEKMIKEKSRNVPTEHFHLHGNAVESAQRMKEENDKFYYNMREKAKNRIRHEDKKKRVSCTVWNRRP